MARVPSKGSLSLILPSRAGPLSLTGPRTAMPFDRHTCHGLFAPRRSDAANKWCKLRRFFTPFISFYSVGVKNGTFLHQILDSANTPAIRQNMLCKPKRRKSCTHANKAIDIREEILDLITSTSRSARESELRPRIAKHLSGRVRPSRSRLL